MFSLSVIRQTMISNTPGILLKGISGVFVCIQNVYNGTNV